jgi:hypothetical protein
MGKPTALAVAARAVAAVARGHTYAEMDCQAFVEHCVITAGGAMAYAGSNDMARNAVSGLWPLAEARRAGRLVACAGLFIHAHDGGEPARYRADGLGNFSHVGLYVGAKALTDTDKNGNRRACDVVHSSQSMGRVAGSTLANGWTHAGWFTAVDYGAQPSSGAEAGAADGATDGADGAQTGGEASAGGGAGEQASGEPNAPVDTSGFYAVRRGCKGGAVRRLQTWLGDLHYDVGTTGADGDFGPATHEAVCAFQAANGLATDGAVGRQTWRALAQARAAAIREAGGA